MIVDAHVHVARELTGFWEPLRYGQVRDRGQVRQLLPPAFDPPASPPEVLLGYMDAAGVERAIIVQHHMYGDQNGTVLAALAQWPDRFAGYAYLGAFDRPDDPDRLERLLAGGLLGLKVELNSTRRLRPDFRFDGERERRVWERLHALGRPLAIDLIGTPPEDLPALHRLLEELPNLTIVNCHVGGPGGAGWEERARLGAHPRVWSDLAALPLLLKDEEYPFPRTVEFVRWTVEHIGAERLLWGSDYPVVLSQATYRQFLDYLRRHCPFLTAEQQTAILGGNAERFLARYG